MPSQATIQNASATKKAPPIKVLPFVYAVVLTLLLLLFVVLLPRAGTWFKLTVYVAVPVLLVSGLTLYILNKQALFRLLFTCVMLLCLFLAAYMGMERAGLFAHIADLDGLRALILQSGNWGKLVFCVIQFLQVVILPVPSILIYLAGILLYGSLTTFMLSAVSVILGSIVSFFIGRIFGKKLVEFIVGKAEAKKYRKYLGDKGKVPFVLMLLFPFFPDDILCMLAGATTMPVGFFIVVVAITRTVTIATTCFLGSGEVIPFSGWGIPVWIGLGVLFVVGCILYNKNKRKIEALFLGKGKKAKKTGQKAKSVHKQKN